MSILRVNNNSFRGPLIMGTFEKFQSQERYQSAHSENAKWPRVKLKKNYVGKESSGSVRR